MLRNPSLGFFSKSSVGLAEANCDNVAKSYVAEVSEVAETRISATSAKSFLHNCDYSIFIAVQRVSGSASSCFANVSACLIIWCAPS